MTTNAPPSDAASLLVPVHLDAWVVDSQNQEGVAWYYSDFSKLKTFKSPIPQPFEVSDVAKPTVGVHLHWALPDALTHGGETDTEEQFAFPFAPNRWLIARFNVPVVGTTQTALAGSGVSMIQLQAGAREPLEAGMPLQIVSPDGQTTVVVTVSAPVSQGAAQIQIQAHDFTPSLPFGSAVQRVAANSSLPQPNGPWQCKLWVVQSDYLAPTLGAVGATANALSGAGVTTIPLQTPGAGVPVAAGVALELVTPDGKYAATVVTSAPTAAGAAQIQIQPQAFASGFPAGSIVQLQGSAFLDPSQPSYMTVAPTQTTFAVNYATLGASYRIDAWEALPNRGTGQLFLQAVGPGNVSFAAYAPFVKNVFNFTDKELPPEGTGVYTYTYMVIGWYSDPQTADPLRGVTTYPQGDAAYVPAIWASEAEWQAESAAARFQAIINFMRWSIQGDPPESPPATSLYHGLVSDLQWPHSTLGNAGIDQSSIRVAVGNTSIDALAALIQAEAQQEASENPSDSAAWILAGYNLAGLIQAAMYDLLDVYGTPGGTVLLEQQIEQAWYGSNPGGTIWHVVTAEPQAAGQSASQPTLTPEQTEELNTQLAALNAQQRACDEAQQQLESQQADFYMMWLKYGLANIHYGWGQAPLTTPSWAVLSQLINTQFYPQLLNQVWDLYCSASAQQAQLPNPTDDSAANQWAQANWSFTPSDGGAGTVTLAELGLKLKADTAPRFWHPNDPVVLIAGLDRAQRHGEDGRYNDDGTLTCRLPGQTITGIQISGQPDINVQTLSAGGLDLAPCGQYASIPSITNLLQEAFLVDPGNAAVMAAAVNGDAAVIARAVTGLLGAGECQADAGGDSPPAANWTGQPPPPFAITPWTQAWAPLFLEWEVHYYPTGTAGQFSLADWNFDGHGYTWSGSGFAPDYYVGYKGRTLLTPQAPLLFKSQIQTYLTKHAGMDSPELESLLDTVACWDLLSQSLGGLTDQLITRLSQETFPPPASGDSTVQCPRPETGEPAPDVRTLVGDQYHSMPILESQNVNYFFPLRGGFLQFQQLQIVDTFGQTFGGEVSDTQSGWPLTGQGFLPLLGQGLAPNITAGQATPPSFPYGALQLPPRVVQSTRLNLSFLTNDDSGQDVVVSDNVNAVCGWLLPNHLDGGISVYDETGLLLGELWPLPQPDNWRPRPGPPGAVPPPQSPADIRNGVLRSVITSIAAQPTDVFNALLGVIDETLWMIDPLGGRKDQFLSVLIGRPLAIVQVELTLSLLGSPVYNQYWDKMAIPNPSPPPDYNLLRDAGNVQQIAFPVRLGSLELRDDGLIGYYLPQSDDYVTFYAVHRPKTSEHCAYIRPIVRPPTADAPAQYQGDITLKCQSGGPAPVGVTATLLMDPRGCVHAYTGILPVASAALSADIVEEFIKQLQVTFRTGPIIADPGTLRTPKPAEDQGTWAWVQAVPPPTAWELDQIVDADDIARLPDAQLQLREGWLQLSGLATSDS